MCDGLSTNKLELFLSAMTIQPVLASHARSTLWLWMILLLRGSLKRSIGL